MPNLPDPSSQFHHSLQPPGEDGDPIPELCATTIARLTPHPQDLQILSPCQHCSPWVPSWDRRVQEMTFDDLELEELADPIVQGIHRATEGNVEGLLAFCDAVNRLTSENEGSLRGMWLNFCDKADRLFGWFGKHVKCQCQEEIGRFIQELRQSLRIPLTYEEADAVLVYRFLRLSHSQQDEVRRAALDASPRLAYPVTFAVPFMGQRQDPTALFKMLVVDYGIHHRTTQPREMGLLPEVREMVRRDITERLLRDRKFLELSADALYVLFGIEISPTSPVLAVFTRLPKDAQHAIKARIHRSRWDAINDGQAERVPFPWNI